MPGSLVAKVPTVFSFFILHYYDTRSSTDDTMQHPQLASHNTIYTAHRPCKSGLAMTTVPEEIRCCSIQKTRWQPVVGWRLSVGHVLNLSKSNLNKNDRQLEGWRRSTYNSTQPPNAAAPSRTIRHGSSERNHDGSSRGCGWWLSSDCMSVEWISSGRAREGKRPNEWWNSAGRQSRPEEVVEETLLGRIHCSPVLPYIHILQRFSS